MSRSSVKCTPNEIKVAFRWRCAVCHRNFPHPSCSKDLRVHYIDLNPKHRRPQNMVAVCRRCRSPLQEEASHYFQQYHPQLSLFPHNDYRSHLEDLWVLGLQMDFFEEFLDPELSESPGIPSHPTPKAEQLEFYWLDDQQIFSENAAMIQESCPSFEMGS